MIRMREKVYWLVMVDYEYVLQRKGRIVYGWQSELIVVVFEVRVVKEEKPWGVLVVMGRHRAMMGITFGVVIVEYLGSFGERFHLSFEA